MSHRRPPSRTGSGSRARGQAMTEFIIVVALVAIGTIGVVGIYGDNLRRVFGASSAALAGKSNVQSRGVRTVNNGYYQKNLKNFGTSSMLMTGGNGAGSSGNAGNSGNNGGNGP